MKTTIKQHTDRFGRRGFLVVVEWDGRTGYSFHLTQAEANRAFETARERLWNGLSPMGGTVDTIEEACGEVVYAA